jgi:SulP family sulfate permease
MIKLLKEIIYDLKPATLFPALCIGTFLGLLITIVQISFAALIFSGPMSHLTARGAGLTLAGALIVGVITSLYSSFKSMISLPEDALVAIFSGAAAIIAAQSASKNENIFITIVMALLLTTILTAVLMLIVAKFRLANFFRYIPYPVIGGFLAGSGWLLVIGGLEVMLGSSLNLTNLGLLLAPDSLLLWLPGTVLAILIFCLQIMF